jgi:hypothetical protein
MLMISAAAPAGKAANAGKEPRQASATDVNRRNETVVWDGFILYDLQNF